MVIGGIESITPRSFDIADRKRPVFGLTFAPGCAAPRRLAKRATRGDLTRLRVFEKPAFCLAVPTKPQHRLQFPPEASNLRTYQQPGSSQSPAKVDSHQLGTELGQHCTNLLAP